MGKAVAGRDLSGTDFIGLGIPGDHRLGSGAARRCADSQDVLQGLFPASRHEGASEGRAFGEDLASELD